ncbi:tryptophan-rich sensory protein [Patescibacteria group bacterium]|nr:tryptophan-rich sensory protein [Patescibacteria group bacterium]
MKIFPVLISILIAQLAGIIGSFFTVTSVNTWYLDLVKPAWNPSSWIFGPVWITLYTLMGIAAYLVWRSNGASGVKIALLVYGVHLVLNALWSILFFGLNNPAVAFFEILLLLVFILVTIFLFWKINPWAGALLLPYLGWVSFAAFLNYTIWQLN